MEKWKTQSISSAPPVLGVALANIACLIRFTWELLL